MTHIHIYISQDQGMTTRNLMTQISNYICQNSTRQNIYYETSEPLEKISKLQFSFGFFS